MKSRHVGICHRYRQTYRQQRPPLHLQPSVPKYVSLNNELIWIVLEAKDLPQDVSRLIEITLSQFQGGTFIFKINLDEQSLKLSST